MKEKTLNTERTPSLETVERKKEAADCAESGQCLAENLKQREAIEALEEHKARVGRRLEATKRWTGDAHKDEIAKPLRGMYTPYPQSTSSSSLLSQKEAAAKKAAARQGKSAEARSSEDSDADYPSSIPYDRLCSPSPSPFLKRKAATRTDWKPVPKTPRAKEGAAVMIPLGGDVGTFTSEDYSDVCFSSSSSSSSATTTSCSSTSSCSEVSFSDSSSEDTDTTTDSPKTPAGAAGGASQAATASIAGWPKYSRYEQEKFLQPLATQTDFVINTLGSHFPKGPYRLQSLDQLHPTELAIMRLPIIVVPADPNGLITLNNIRDMLMDLKFKKPQPKEQQLPWGPVEERPQQVIIERWFAGGINRKYRIIDNVSKLSCDEWRRIVAVFACGPIEQFKNWWPWKGNPKFIFLNVCAFHMYLKGTPVHQDLVKLLETKEVNPLEMNLAEPYTHSGTLLSFWGTLDKFVHSNGRFRFLLEDYYPANEY